MFEELSNKLQEISNKVSNKGFLNAENIVSALQEVKIALLEADVNFRVVNSFLKKVKEKASGTEVIGNLSAGQQFIKVIHRELTLLLWRAETIFSAFRKPLLLTLLEISCSLLLSSSNIIIK